MCKSRRSFLCVLKLISCSRTKPKHQFIVASSFCIEKLLINIWSFIAQPVAAKKDYSCWKLRLHFESLISCLILFSSSSKFESCLSENETSVRKLQWAGCHACFSIMRSCLSQLSNKYCDCDLPFSMSFSVGKRGDFLSFGNWKPAKAVISKLLRRYVTNKGCFLILA